MLSYVHRRVFVRQSLLIYAVSFCLSVVGRAADWPHWRGADRTDVTAESSGWDGTSWLKGDLWELSAGEGSSSPLVVGDRVFLTGWADGQDHVFCVQADTGTELWRQSYPAPRYGRFAIGDQGFYSGACSTPEFDVELGLLFTLSADGDLNAWDTRKNGHLVWNLNLYEKYGAVRRPEVAVRKKTRRDYGYTTSPLVIDDQLIVEVGGREGNLVAFDKRTGKPLWTGRNGDEAGHSGGPVPITVDGVPCVVVLTLRNLVVTRIDRGNAGKVIAEVPWTTDFGNNIPTPAVSGRSVIVTTSYNQASMCRVDVSLTGAKKVWESTSVSAVCSPVIHESRIYWAWRGVHCVDFETGRELWKGGKIAAPGSCVLTSDDRLIVYGNKGDLSLIETAKRSPDRFQQLETRRIFQKTDAWPHVVLAGGRVICRDRDGHVRCLAVTADTVRP